MRILLVDNYDSFAYNLVQALGALGADVVVRRNDRVTVAEALDLDPDGVVISPGPCTPAEAGISVELVSACAEAGLPLLGVCLGHQSVAAAFGGRVVRADRLLHGKTCPVQHDGDGLFAGLPDPFVATRYHSLIVEEPLPAPLLVTAWTDRSQGAAGREVMGLRHRHLPIHGVQFHPESFLSPQGPALLANFLAGPLTSS